MLITCWYLYLAARILAKQCKYCCFFCVWLLVISRWTLQKDNVWDKKLSQCFLFFSVMDLDDREVMLPLVLCNPSTLTYKTQRPECSIYEVWARSLQDCFHQLCLYRVFVTRLLPTCFLTRNALLFLLPPLLLSSALNMTSILKKLITPLFSGPPEPPRNKVTVVGVGQVGMACAISILLRVRVPLVFCLFSDYLHACWCDRTG